MLKLGTKVVSTWSPHVAGTIIGYGYLWEPESADNETHQVYVVDMGRPRMFDVNREGPGPAAARTICLRVDRVLEQRG
jgi:hypothetical protein